VIVCSPHCGLSPESGSGGEVYERELLTRLPVIHKILLAKGKLCPAALDPYVTRFPIRRGLHWSVTPFVVPDALHGVYPFNLLRAHSLKYMGPACLLARWRWRWPIPIVAHHHHLDGTGPWPIERAVVRRVDRVIVGSKFARRQLADHGFRTDHVRVVPYGIDERFKPQPGRALPFEDTVRILYLGGLKARKNLALLLEVWRDLDRPNAILMIAGDGPERAKLLEDVPCLGYVLEADKPGIYQSADIFVSPSTCEGFGLSVGEAMSTGLATVTSDGGSLPELVDDAGIICRTKEDYVRALRMLIDEPAVRQCFGEAARKRIDRYFRWERCVEETMAVYREVVR